MTPEPDRRALDLRLVPVAVAAWVGAVVGLLADVRVTLGVVGMALVGVLVVRGPRVRAALGCAAATTLIAGLSVQASSTGPVATLARERAVVTVQARLDADAKVLPARGFLPALARVDVTTVWVEGRGRHIAQRIAVVLEASGDAVEALAPIPAGSIILVEGRLEQTDRWDPAAARVRIRGQPQVVRPPGAVDAAVNRVRAGLRDAMRFSPAQQAALVPSLVVGDTTQLDPGLVDAFQATGLTHLTAVSGTNLTLMLSFLVVASGWLGVLGWSRRVVQVAGVVAFVLLCRGEPSVLRAAAMGVVGLAALGGPRATGRGVRHLCVAIIVLCLLDPWLALSWGFALSVAASAGILWWGGVWQETMSAWAPGWLAEALAIPLAAQIATQPLVSALSGQVSVIGIIANALAGPFVGPVTVLGLVATLASLAGWVAVVPGWLAGWCVQPVIWIAQVGAATPAGTRDFGSTPVVVAVIAVACLVVARAMGWLLARRWATLALIVGLVAVSVIRLPTPGWPGNWRVIVCDVGQGDATLIRAGPASAILVDTGPEDGDAVGCLRTAGVREIVALVITHYHADHVGGLAAVLDAVPVRTLVIGPVVVPATGRALGLAARHSVGIHTTAVGETWTAGEATWHTVGAAPLAAGTTGGEGESGAENDTSVIGVASSGGLSILIAGDAEPAGQEKALANHLSLRCDILKLPHHGSSRQDSDFFAATGASLAVTSAGVDNDYGHPSAKTVRLAEGMGMTHVSTQDRGSLALTRVGDLIQVRGTRRQ